MVDRLLNAKIYDPDKSDEKVTLKKVFQLIGFLGTILRFMFELTLEICLIGASKVTELKLFVVVGVKVVLPVI